jgi:hypothetical protein
MPAKQFFRTLRRLPGIPLKIPGEIFRPIGHLSSALAALSALARKSADQSGNFVAPGAHYPTHFSPVHPDN